MRRTCGWPARLALVTLLAGCMGSSNEKDNLVDQVRLFHDSLRWRRFGEAAAQLRLDQRARFLDALRPVRDEVEVTDYEVTRTEPQASGTHIQIAIEWQSKRTGTLEKTELSEQWEHISSSWLLAQVRVIGGTPVPLLRGLTDSPSRATIGEGTPQP